MNHGPVDGALPLTASRREVPLLEWRDSAGSTNTELVRLASDPGLPTFTTLVTADQSAGRGRLDRAWIAPASTALAISVLVRAEAPTGRPIPGQGLGWLALAAGAAMFDAVSAVLPSGAQVGVKWPNDVQLDGRKVCGILSELVPPSAASPGGGGWWSVRG
jgi:Biotin-(acetyl-CoA carboxylase) ligase